MAHAKVLPGASRHECWRLGWSTCSACLGRVHLTDCTSRQDPKKDCCAKRHERLHADGQTRGLDDSSVVMLGSHQPPPGQR